VTGVPAAAPSGVCSVVSPVCAGLGVIGDALGGAVGSVAGSVFDAAASALAQGMARATQLVVTFWVDVPVPGLSAEAGPAAELRSGTAWLTGWLAVLSLLVGAARMVVTRSGRPAVEAFRGLLLLLVVLSGAGVAVVQLLVVAGDGYARWILDRSAGGDLGRRLVGLSTAGSTAALGSGLLLVVGLLGMLAALAQLGLMLIRVAVVTLFAGLLPLAAAGAGTETGLAWLRKVLAWLLAFVLYKPVAATVYASAFLLIGQGRDAVSVLSGLSLLVLSVLALPALLRLVTPAVGAAVGAAAGGGAAAAVGAALATGARMSAGRGPGPAPGWPAGPAPVPGAAPAPPGARGAASSAAAGPGVAGAARAAGGGAAAPAAVLAVLGAARGSAAAAVPAAVPPVVPLAAPPAGDSAGDSAGDRR